MKDDKLTQIMFKSLAQDHKAHSFEEWHKAGDWAIAMRFFPHAFNCFQMAAAHNKDENTLVKINDILDKITNVLEFIPEKLKEPVEDIRLSNPLDPAKWLAMSNTLLKDATAAMADGKALNPQDGEAVLFALSFAAYCAARSGAAVEPINEVLKDILEPVDIRSWTSGKVNLQEIAQNKDDGVIKVVALGDNVTLGLQSNWEIKFDETYHYLWSKDCGANISLANNAISGAGVLDLALYLGRDAMYYKPDIAIINYGINDAWLGPSILMAYESLLSSCIQMLQNNGIRVILVEPIPHIASACPPDQRPTEFDLKDLETKAYAEACKRVAIRTSCILANAHNKFPDDENERAKYLENGFNQPNLEGQKLIKSALDEVTA